MVPLTTLDVTDLMHNCHRLAVKSLQSDDHCFKFLMRTISAGRRLRATHACHVLHAVTRREPASLFVFININTLN